MWPLRKKSTPTLEATPERELVGLALWWKWSGICRDNAPQQSAPVSHRGIIGSDWEAGKVVQDSYVRAFRGLGTFRQEAALGNCADISEPHV